MKSDFPFQGRSQTASHTEILTLLPKAAASPQVGFSLFSNDGSQAADATSTALVPLDAAPVPQTESEPSAPVDVASDTPPPDPVLEEPPPATLEAVASTGEAKELPQPESTPAEMIFSAVRAVIHQILSVPMKDAEVAAALDVSAVQAKAWLQRLIDEGDIEKQKKPAGYIVKQKRLFE